MYEQYRGELSKEIFNILKAIEKIETVDELRKIGTDLSKVLNTFYEWLRDIEKRLHE